VALGSTYLKDNAGAGEYTLEGGDVQLRLGKNSRLVGEYAETRGVEARVFSSSDGGTTFEEITPLAATEGRGWKGAAELDVGEWLGHPDRATLRGYLKRVDPDFFSSGSLQDRGRQKEGVGASLGLTSRDRLAFRYDRDEPVGGGPGGAGTGATSDLTSMLMSHDAGRWGLAAEYQAQNFTAGNAGGLPDRQAIGSASLWAKPTSRLAARLERQQTFSGPDNDQSRLSLQYQVLSRLSLEAKGTKGTAGQSALGGAVLSLGGGDIYVNRRLAEDGLSRTASTVVGAQVPLGPSSRAYTEYQWERANGADRRLSLVGLHRQWESAPGVSLFLNGEYGETDAQPARTNRTSLAGGLSYAGASGLKASTRGEWRRETGGTERAQYFTSQHLESRLGADLVALGDYRYGITRDRTLDRTEARFESRSIGLAFRPLAHDRVNALARYTRLSDLRSATAGDSLARESIMDVLSAEGTLDLSARMEWSGKGATRTMRDQSDAAPATTTRTYLVLNRLSSAVWGPLRFGVEYRLLGQREARDQRRGWLNELTWEGWRNVRVGVGYNFTDFSDNEFARNNYSVRGWFVRAQGKY
jgi:hypothetical protein